MNAKEILRALYPIGHERRMNRLAKALADMLIWWKK